MNDKERSRLILSLSIESKHKGTIPVSRIAQLRKRAGLTQLQLAQLIGVTETTIANWETNRISSDRIAKIIKLCHVFNCDAEDLIEYVPDPNLAEEDRPKERQLKFALDNVIDSIVAYERVENSNNIKVIYAPASVGDEEISATVSPEEFKKAYTVLLPTEVIS